MLGYWWDCLVWTHLPQPDVVVPQVRSSFLGISNPPRRRPSASSASVKDENPHVKVREHLQVVTKECSKPIAKFIQLYTGLQASYCRALETFISKTVRGCKTCWIEARRKRYDQADSA